LNVTHKRTHAFVPISFRGPNPILAGKA